MYDGNIRGKERPWIGGVAQGVVIHLNVPDRRIAIFDVGSNYFVS